MQDYMIRTTAANGRIRVFIAQAGGLVEEARKIHQTTPVATAALGRLLIAGTMMGVMLKGEHDELTLRIQGNGPIGTMIVTADSLGGVRGYIANPGADVPPKSPGKLDVGKAVGTGSLTVIRDMGLKEPYSGQVELVSGEIAEDLTYYFASSEQVPSSVALGVLVEKDYHVRSAGGMIIQLMPDAGDEIIDELENTLKELPPITKLLEEGMRPEDILERTLGSFKPEAPEKIPVCYRCTCSQERVERAVLSLPRKELREMISEGNPLEIKCDFCKKSYEIPVERLKQMLEAALASRFKIIDGEN